jgi:hypothetical protein
VTTAILCTIAYLIGARVPARVGKVAELLAAWS